MIPLGDGTGHYASGRQFDDGACRGACPTFHCRGGSDSESSAIVGLHTHRDETPRPASVASDADEFGRMTTGAGHARKESRRGHHQPTDPLGDHGDGSCCVPCSTFHFRGHGPLLWIPQDDDAGTTTTCLPTMVGRDSEKRSSRQSRAFRQSLASKATERCC